MQFPRPIDAYELSDRVHRNMAKNPHTDPIARQAHINEHEHFLKMIAMASTVNFEALRPTAYWISRTYQTYIPVEYDSDGELILHPVKVYECNRCGRTEKNREPYCNCGAKMDFEIDERMFEKNGW